MKINQILEFHARIHKTTNNGNHIISYENHENHEIIELHERKYVNHENPRILYEKHENQEHIIILRENHNQS